MDFTAPWPQPLLEAMGELGSAADRPNRRRRPNPTSGCAGWHAPAALPTRRAVALQHGFRRPRRADRPRGRATARRVPAGSGARAARHGRHRLRDAPTSPASARATPRTPRTGERLVFDPPDGQWATPPAFPSAAAGSCRRSTTCPPSGACCSRAAACPTARGCCRGHRRGDDHRPPRRGREVSGPSPDGSQGWGFGVGVQVRRTGLGPTVGSYGWDGGLGSSWANDPTERLVGVVLTTDMFTGPLPATRRDPGLLDLRLRRSQPLTWTLKRTATCPFDSAPPPHERGPSAHLRRSCRLP